MAYIEVLSEGMKFVARINVDDYKLNDPEDRKSLMERIAANVREADHEDASEWEDDEPSDEDWNEFTDDD